MKKKKAAKKRKHYPIAPIASVTASTRGPSCGISLFDYCKTEKIKIDFRRRSAVRISGPRFSGKLMPGSYLEVE